MSNAGELQCVCACTSVYSNGLCCCCFFFFFLFFLLSFVLLFGSGLLARAKGTIRGQDFDKHYRSSSRYDISKTGPPRYIPQYNRRTPTKL